MTVKEKFEYWKKNCKDADLCSRLAAMEGDSEKIEDAFYKDLDFGTGGMRGVLGAGTNCMNIYTVAKVTKGIARYLKDNGGKSVVICRDSRLCSDEFASVATRVFAADGITVTVAHDIMPTPFLSYMVWECAADAGVMITASHNPACYNGYKVYNKHGYQVTDQVASDISLYISGIDVFGIVSESLSYYTERGLVKHVDEAVIEKYLDKVFLAQLDSAAGLKIAFSPLNGAGYSLVPRALKRAGLTDLYIVEEQGYPDGSFPTCPSPNPEKKEALALVIKLGHLHNCDIALATDPDADRLGVAVRHNGEFVLLSGNELGVLLTDYLFSEYKKRGLLPEEPLLVKTIVTTGLAAEVAKSYGGKCLDVLTGFKYIGELITDLEKQGKVNNYMLGFEESYGYLHGKHARDKDAVEAAVIVAGMAARCKNEGQTLIDKLAGIYKKFGTYQHRTVSFEYAGASGGRRIAVLLDEFRKKIPNFLGCSKIISVTDYLCDDTGLPSSNVIKIDTEAGSRVIIRPSGTEPLIKFYISVSKSAEANKIEFEKISQEMGDFFRP